MLRPPHGHCRHAILEAFCFPREHQRDAPAGVLPQVVDLIGAGPLQQLLCDRLAERQASDAPGAHADLVRIVWVSAVDPSGRLALL